MTSKNVLIAIAVSLVAGPALADAPSRSEATPCCAVTAADVARLLRPDAIAAVKPLHRITRTGRHLRGVSIVYRRVAGMTVEELQATADCLIAQGRSLPSSSPLSVSGARVRASSDRDRLRLTVTAADEASARDVVERALALRAAARQ